MALIDTADNRTDGERMVLHRDARTGQPVHRAMPRPEPGVDEVLAEVHAAGIKVSDCTSAASTDEAHNQLTSTEFAGRIASFGGGDGEGRFILGHGQPGRSARAPDSVPPSPPTSCRCRRPASVGSPGRSPVESLVDHRVPAVALSGDVLVHDVLRSSTGPTTGTR